MTKKNGEAQPVVLAEILAERADKHPPIEIDLGDGGEPLRVPPIEMWDDDVIDLADRDRVAAMRQLLGEDYARWTAAGGNAGVLSDIVIGRVGLGK